MSDLKVRSEIPERPRMWWCLHQASVTSGQAGFGQFMLSCVVFHACCNSRPFYASVNDRCGGGIIFHECTRACFQACITITPRCVEGLTKSYTNILYHGQISKSEEQNFVERWGGEESFRFYW